MANTVNKHLNIYVNGKEVENTIKSIDGALGYLRNKIRSLENGSPEQQALIEQYRQLKKISDDNKEALHGMNKEMESTSSELENMTDKTKKWFTAAAVFGVGKIVGDTVGKISSSISEYVEAFATLDDAMAAVRKTTGMTTEEVDQLKESLKNIDTRTATNELLKIAEQGGRLGIAKEDIESFTKAVDVANVALGDSFGGGAEEIATVLGKIRNAYKETNTGEIGDSFNRIGSVINELGATSAASEQNIAEFTRRVGAMPEVFKPSIQEAMALGAAFEENSVDAEIASRSYGVFMKTASADISKFAQAMGEPVDAMRELINTNPTAFALKFSETLKGLNATQTGEYLKNLGLNADGVSKVLGALSNNTDRVREMIQTANTAFSEGTSLMNEFNVVNNNTAAQLEKAKKAAADATAELGEKLTPVLIAITNGTAGFMKVLVSVAKVLLDNKAIVLAAAAAYATLYAIKSKNIIMDKAHSVVIKLKTIALSQQEAVKLKSIARTAQKMAMDKKAILTTQQETLALMKKRMETLKGIAADNQMKAVMAQEIVVKNAATIATQKQAQAARMAAAATKAQKAAFASTPWGAIIMAVTAIAAGIYKLATRTTAAEKAMKEFNEESSKEEAQARNLFSALKNTEKGTDDYKRILEKLKELYPDIIQAHLDESGALKNIDAAYQDVITSIRTKIAMQTKEKAITETMSKAIENQKELYEKFRKRLKENGATDGEIDLITNGLSEVIKNGEYVSDYFNQLKKQYKNIDFDDMGIFDSSAHGYAIQIYRSESRLKKDIERIEQSFSPFINKASSGVDDITAKIKELKKAFEITDEKDEKKSILQQIKDYEAQLEAIKKPTGGSGSGNNNECTGDQRTCQCAECKRKRNEDWAKAKSEFENELKKFELQNRLNQLGEWQKTKTQIESQYDEMIDKTVKFYGKNSEIAKKLESEKGDAVIRAGKDYMKKYSDFLTSFNETANKMLQEQEFTPIESKLLAEINTTNAAFDKKREELSVQIESLYSIIEDIKPGDTEYQEFNEILNKLIDQNCQLVLQKTQATIAIIKKHVSETSDFIKSEEKIITDSSKTESEKQIDVINERYNSEIKKIEEYIKEKNKLRTNDNAEVTDIEIESLEKLILKLKELQAERIKLVTEEPSGKSQKNKSTNWLTDILDIDWAKFKDNWVSNLATMADAAQSFANEVLDIFSNINTIKSQQEEQELADYQKNMDKRTNYLNKQLDNGVVSQEYYDAQLKALEEKKEAKELEIKKRQFKRDKEMALAQAIMSAAVSLAKCFELGPIAGAISAAMVAATTATQIALIATQPEPYAKGGYINSKKIILAGEDGNEWIASNKLLNDKNTAPIISELQKYQTGHSSLFDNMTPNAENLSKAAQKISTNFETKSTERIIEKHYVENSTNEAMLKQMTELNNYLKNPKNRQVTISRKIQTEFENNETFLRNQAQL